MAYERYDRDDRWRGGRDERERGRGDWDREPRGSRERDERGFFERAGDEMSSWFGGGDRDRERMESERGREGDWFSGRREHEREHERGRRERDEDRSFEPMHWSQSNRDYRQDYRRGNEREGYRPMAGDYGRSGEERGDYGRGSQWERDEYRRTSFAGSAARSNHDDPPYDEWRRRHMDALDQDYERYCRENESRFERDFGEWRERREGKRQLMSRVREHMEVVGSDGEHLGTVDRTAGDRLILTRSDPESGGTHHSISCAMIDRVEDDRVILDRDADKARERWRDDERERALFEREDQGEAGPGILNRSFSGTYR